MPTERKIAMVADLTDKMQRMQLAVVADYRGMSVADMVEMRAKFREVGADVVVAKNTLLRIAARETDNTALEELLVGPTAISFAYDDVASAAKTMHDFFKRSQKISVRGSLLGTSVLPADGLEDVTKLPTRQEVLAQIVGTVQSPLAGLVGVLNAPVADVVGILHAVPGDLVGVLQARITQLEEQQDAAA